MYTENQYMKVIGDELKTPVLIEMAAILQRTFSNTKKIFVFD